MPTLPQYAFMVLFSVKAQTQLYLFHKLFDITYKRQEEYFPTGITKYQNYSYQKRLVFLSMKILSIAYKELRYFSVKMILVSHKLITTIKIHNLI